MLALSQMARQIQPSATLAAAAKARQLKAQGVHVYDFSVGQPDFPTPKHICQAALKAMERGHTGYTPAQGTAELRTAVSAWYRRTYGLEFGPDQVVVSSGAKHAIYNVFQALLGPGDEAIIPAPFWGSYSEMVEMTGARAVLVPTTLASGFKISPQQLRAAITPRTRLFLINSPGNPTGSVYTRAELSALADVVLDSPVAVLSDEIYERLIFGNAAATCFATLRPGLAERTITVSGVSKTYAMTGWRIGWSIAQPRLSKAIGDIQSQQTSCPCSVSQCAALTALEGEQDCVEAMRREFQARRDLVCRRLAEVPGVKCPVPDGAFYAFFDVSAHFGRTIAGKAIKDSLSFCAAALETAHVCLVQGSAFGAEGFVRLSFAASQEELAGGLDALARWLA
jgi:aspartate aminotransferase